MRRAVELLRGRGETVIWAALRSERHKPGSSAGDAAALATVLAAWQGFARRFAAE